MGSEMCIRDSFESALAMSLEMIDFTLYTLGCMVGFILSEVGGAGAPHRNVFIRSMPTS